jgi:hypothetical protein
VPVSLGHEGLEQDTYLVKTRTDDKGLATLALPRGGHGFIKAHVIRRTDDLGKARWESFWASLTFRVTGKSDVSGKLQSIRAIHGSLGPWPVLGYRAAEIAMRTFALSHGSSDLLAVVQTPLREPFAALADGVQAATGVSTGRLSLQLAPTSDASDMLTKFTNPSTGRTMSIRPRPEWLDRLQHTPPEEIESAAMQLATLGDDELFVIDPPAPNDASPLAASLVSRAPAALSSAGH